MPAQNHIFVNAHGFVKLLRSNLSFNKFWYNAQPQLNVNNIAAKKKPMVIGRINGPIDVATESHVGLAIGHTYKTDPAIFSGTTSGVVDDNCNPNDVISTIAVSITIANNIVGFIFLS